MAEGSAAAEVAHHIIHSDHDEGEGGRDEHKLRHELIEIAEAVLLAIVAVATAWSGYQSTLWDSTQAHLYGVSSRDRALATQTATLAGQQQLYDSNVFSFWLQANAHGDTKQEDIFEKRFRPEFAVAFEAWLKTDPFHNPKAPPGPLVMKQYRNAATAKAAVYNAQATTAFAQGTDARETGDKFVRDTVLLATVLFLIALAQRFTVKGVRVGILVVAGIMLAIGLVMVFDLPSS
jgi:hypothetical protein